MKGADQTAKMRRLVCAFVVRMQQNQAGFSVIYCEFESSKNPRSFESIVGIPQSRPTRYVLLEK